MTDTETTPVTTEAVEPVITTEPVTETPAAETIPAETHPIRDDLEKLEHDIVAEIKSEL